MTNKVVEIGPRPFPYSHIKPDIKVGDMVFVKWANNKTYKGFIKNKLGKFWGVMITDEDWPHSVTLTNVPESSLAKRNY